MIIVLVFFWTVFWVSVQLKLSHLCVYSYFRAVVGKANSRGITSLMKLNLEPIILREQSNLGDTIIDKLEHTSPMAFSVVLISLDDKACPIIDPSVLKPRPRQSAVSELGLFIGRLGREKVCAICTEGAELPSDSHGVVYIPFGAAGA